MTFLQSVLAPAMSYLKLATPTESDLDKLKRQRQEINQKLTLTNQDRELISRLDKLIMELS